MRQVVTRYGRSRAAAGGKAVFPSGHDGARDCRLILALSDPDRADPSRTTSAHDRTTSAHDPLDALLVRVFWSFGRCRRPTASPLTDRRLA